MNKCKKEDSIIHIYQPPQHYINNTMTILQIFKHFNFTKCLGFPFGTLKGIVLKVSVFYKPIIKLGIFDWTEYNIVKGLMKI